MSVNFFYGPTARQGAVYYGVIAWDRKGGGDHQRLWESPKFADPNDARDAVNAELQQGNYPDIGRSQHVVEIMPSNKWRSLSEEELSELFSVS